MPKNNKLLRNTHPTDKIYRNTKAVLLDKARFRLSDGYLTPNEQFISSIRRWWHSPWTRSARLL